MKLSQETLSNYFSIADSESSWYTKPTNTFDFVDRDSDTLVVTVGDSWTWGTNIVDRAQQYTKERIDACYGNIIAQELSADWLNLALNAVSNFWIATMVEELAAVIPRLEYQRIVVVCTFSPAGRWFDTKYDQYIDYVEWFKNNTDFNKLLPMMNRECVRRIQQALTDPRVRLLVGTTWADPCGFDDLRPNQLLATPWYQLLDCGQSEPAYFCHYHERLSTATQFMDAGLHRDFKLWFLRTVNATEQRLQLLKDPAKFDNSHPLAEGHRLWANYILSHL